MVQRLTALALIPLLLVCNMTIVVTVAGFNLNRNYIAEKLCENRDKPQMQCKGKCYLAKKLKQAEEEKKQEQEIQKQVLQNPFLPENPFELFKAEVAATINTPYKDFSAEAHHDLVFQPPR